MSQLTEALARMDLFAGLEGADLEAVAGLAESSRVAEGHVVFREGSEGDAMFAIVTGTIRIAKGKGVLPGQYERFLATLGPGSVFGEMALLLREPRNATAVAAVPTELYRLSKPAFDGLVARQDALACRLLHGMAAGLCRRIRSMDEGLMGLEKRAIGGAIGPPEVAVLRQEFVTRGLTI